MRKTPNLQTRTKKTETRKITDPALIDTSEWELQKSGKNRREDNSRPGTDMEGKAGYWGVGSSSNAHRLESFSHCSGSKPPLLIIT